MSFTVNVVEFVPPELSVAVIVMALDPAASGIVAVQEDVPDAVPLPPVAAFDQLTWVIGDAPEAVPLTVRGDDEAVDGGEVTVTLGGVPPPAVL